MAQTSDPDDPQTDYFGSIADDAFWQINDAVKQEAGRSPATNRASRARSQPAVDTDDRSQQMDEDALEPPPFSVAEHCAAVPNTAINEDDDGGHDQDVVDADDGDADADFAEHATVLKRAVPAHPDRTSASPTGPARTPPIAMTPGCGGGDSSPPLSGKRRGIKMAGDSSARLVAVLADDEPPALDGVESAAATSTVRARSMTGKREVHSPINQSECNADPKEDSALDDMDVDSVAQQQPDDNDDDDDGGDHGEGAESDSLIRLGQEADHPFHSDDEAAADAEGDEANAGDQDNTVAREDDAADDDGVRNMDIDQAPVRSVTSPLSSPRAVSASAAAAVLSPVRTSSVSSSQLLASPIIPRPFALKAPDTSLQDALKRYFGFGTLRSFQEGIMYV